jgi:hypothetical protein
MKTDWSDLTFRFDEEETELGQNIVNTYETVTSKFYDTISFLINRRAFLLAFKTTSERLTVDKREKFNHGRRQKAANYHQPLLHMFVSCYTMSCSVTYIFFVYKQKEAGVTLEVLRR